MINVVAAIIENNGRFLICKRKAGGNCAFLWEFPGGKIEEGETPFEAIVREIEEELSLKIEPISVFKEYDYGYPDRDIHFYFINAKICSGKLTLKVHEKSQWIKPQDKADFDFAPADLPIINILCNNIL